MTSHKNTWLTRQRFELRGGHADSGVRADHSYVSFGEGVLDKKEIDEEEGKSEGGG
jgi:hypothetical protein